MSASFMLHPRVAADAEPANTSWKLENCSIRWCSSSKTILTPPQREKVCGLGWWGDKCFYLMICVYGRAFSVWSTHVENTGMASGSENRRSVWFTEWFTLTHTFFYFFFCFFFFFFFAQGESAASSSGSPAKSSVLSDGSAHSSGSSSSSNQPGSAPEQVHTQQPCSLKGSFSSDNIYAGLHGDGMANQAGPGQGTHYRLMCMLMCVWMGHVIYKTATRAKVNA